MGPARTSLSPLPLEIPVSRSRSAVRPPNPTDPPLRGLLRLARWGPVLTAVAALGVAAEVVWSVRRPLPGLVGIDTSGTVPGRGPGPPLRLVALGDSSLTGPGLEHPDQIWLREALGRLDLDRPIEVLSLAVGGSRVADVAGRVDEALALRPDLVVVAVGSNDVVHATPVRQLTAQLDAVVSRLLDEVTVVAMANVGDMGNVARVPPPLEAVLRARSRTARRAIERVVASHAGAVLLDVTAADPAFRDRSVFAADLFHPGPAGHLSWGEAATPGLGRALDRLAQPAAVLGLGAERSREGAADTQRGPVPAPSSV